MCVSWSAIVRRHFVVERVLRRLLDRTWERRAVASLRRWRNTAIVMTRNAKVLVTLLRRRWRDITRQFLQRWRCTVSRCVLS